MSLKTWKKEFYPRAAAKVSKRNAIAHSLQKWEGLRKSNLRKHKLEQLYNEISEIPTDGSDTLRIDASSCALCAHYIEEECIKCPLFEVRGGIACDQGEDGFRTSAPYYKFVLGGDPLPMIRLLKKAQKAQEAQRA